MAARPLPIQIFCVAILRGPTGALTDIKRSPSIVS
jgi:hypothetical protein